VNKTSNCVVVVLKLLIVFIILQLSKSIVKVLLPHNKLVIALMVAILNLMVYVLLYLHYQLQPAKRIVVRRIIKYGFGIGLIIPSWVILVQLLSNSLVPRFSYFQFYTPGVAFCWFTILVIIGPFSEEALFRGSFYRILRPSLGVIFSAVLSNFAFTFIHGFDTFDRIINVPIMGFLSTIAYEKSGSLWGAVIVHALYNLTIFMYKQ
jgi:membrane protease YdiL (CAAX protease family)